MFLSWIIPAYNEEKRIEKTIRDVDAYLRAQNFSGGYEIVVSD
jgi:glycosyltransferase involved in cell wall biosynthesis